MSSARARTPRLAEMRDAQRAELDALREQVERDAAQLRERVTAEAERLLGLSSSAGRGRSHRGGGSRHGYAQGRQL